MNQNAKARQEILPINPPETAAEQAMTPMALMFKAVNAGASPEFLEKLMVLQERWEANQARKAFDNAMAEAKAELPVILKSREVNFTSAKGRTNYRYEDMAQIAKQVDPPLTKHGLSYRFRTASDGNNVTVTCIISHKDGHSEENSLSAGRDDTGNKNSIQAVGSAITYLQRYTLKAALGLSASVDDDGNGASGKKSEPEISGELISNEQAQKIAYALKFKNRTMEELINWLRKSIPDIGGIDELPVEYYDSCIQKITALKPKD